MGYWLRRASRDCLANRLAIISSPWLAEQRVVIAADWEPSEQRAEILEIRRRAFHDRKAPQDVLARALDTDT